MICPRCKILGKRSRVYCYGSFSTLMYSRPFYDEDGSYHYHDINTYTDSYQCSENHKITVTSKGKCESCDWGHDSEIVTVENIKTTSLDGPDKNSVIKNND